MPSAPKPTGEALESIGLTAIEPGMSGHDVAEKLLSSKRYVTNLRIRLDEGTLHPSLETLLWHHRFGKPADKLELTGKDGGPIKLIRRVIVRRDDKKDDPKG